MRTLAALLIAIICLLTSPAIAQSIHISLPRDGNYQVGNFMPVEITADDEAARSATIVLSADAALSTTVSMGGKQTVVAPMLMLGDDAGNLGWTATGDANAERHAVNLPLQDRSSDEYPQPRPELNCLGGIDAYAPVLSWHPGASPRTRRMAILFASFVSILLIGCIVLIPSIRIRLIATIVVILLAVLGIELWRRNIPPIWSATGQIVVAGSSSTQIDTWQYFTTRSTGRSSAPFRIDLLDGARPIFIDADHARSLHARLLFDGGSSTTTLLCDLPAQAKLAVCSRRISSAQITAAPTTLSAAPIDSPMLPLAQSIYAGAKTTIIGEGDVNGVSDQNIRWRAIVLKSR